MMAPGDRVAWGVYPDQKFGTVEKVVAEIFVHVKDESGRITLFEEKQLQLIQRKGAAAFDGYDID